MIKFHIKSERHLAMHQFRNPYFIIFPHVLEGYVADLIPGKIHLSISWQFRGPGVCPIDYTVVILIRVVLECEFQVPQFLQILWLEDESRFLSNFSASTLAICFTFMEFSSWEIYSSFANSSGMTTKQNLICFFIDDVYEGCWVHRNWEYTIRI